MSTFHAKMASAPVVLLAAVLAVGHACDCGIGGVGGGPRLPKKNLTVYRTTPPNVTGLRNKNSADAAGDLSFIFSAYPAKKMPPNCTAPPSVWPRECWSDGPVASLIGSFQLEAYVDPMAFYEECNPHTVIDPPQGPWFDTRDYECLGAQRRAQKRAAPACPCGNQTMAASPYRSVGVEPAFGVGGTWYSTPIAGECKQPSQPQEHARVAAAAEEEEWEEEAGSGDGCTWRLVRTLKYVHTTCMLSHIDAAVEAWAPQCFRKCSPPGERGACFVACYKAALLGDATQNISRLPASQVVPAWERAFERDDEASGGCPPVKPLSCAGPQCE
jgi:hypothetical protein